MGRLSRDPEVRYTQGEKSTAVARFGIAVDRRGKDEKADFFNVTAFGKTAEFVEKYLKKGTKICLAGRIQQEEWTDKEGQKRTTVGVIAEEVEFCERKQEQPATDTNGFMTVPDNIDGDELPFTF
jgi:single-strand DNA-binding protein